MNKRIILNPYLMDEKTMTPQQYLAKLEQEALDKEFDEIARKQQKELALKQAKQEHEQEFNTLITQLGDYEAELDIAENMYKKQLFDVDITSKQREDTKKLISTLRIKYTKTQKKLNDFIKAEQKL